jgi:hypothetical protein
MNAHVRAQLLAAGAKLPAEAPKKPQNQRTPPQQHTDTKKPAARHSEPEIAKPEILALPTDYYLGPLHLQVACGTHYPGRMRCVLTGPADPGALAAVVAALRAYYQ